MLKSPHKESLTPNLDLGYVLGVALFQRRIEPKDSDHTFPLC